MAGRSSQCRTIGYVDIMGNEIIFPKKYKPAEGRRHVAWLRGRQMDVVERLENGTFDELDEWFYADIKSWHIARGGKLG